MTDENTEQQQPSDGEATRDELIAAVREAGGAESVDVDAEAQASTEAQPPVAPTETPAEPEKTEEEPRIAAILRAREKAAAEREAARNAAQELIEQARQESARMLQEARERADREWQAELERRRQAFEASPTEAVRELGRGDPNRVVDAVLRDGTPEGRAIAELRRELAETKQQAATGNEAKKQIDEMRSEWQRQEVERQIAHARSVFLGQYATQENAPHLHARYDADEIFDRANAVAARWRNDGMQLGKDFDYADVTQYLELESKKRLSPILGSPPAQQVSAGAASGQPGNAPKVSANGPRTLSAAQGSERRTSPRPLSEMKPDEARAALIEEVAAARRANPDAPF